MYEIDAVADRISVFRNGRHIETFPAGARSRDAMIGLMIGQPLKELFPPRVAPPDPSLAPLLSCRALRWEPALDGVDLDVRPGEIVGLGGLDGQGQQHVMHAIFGVLRHLEGAITLDGRPLSSMTPPRAKAPGVNIALVPEDRKTEGLILDMSIEDNLQLAALSRKPFGLTHASDATDGAIARLIERLALTFGRLDDPVKTLSGGNQQKVVLAKWLALVAALPPAHGPDARHRRPHQGADLRPSAGAGGGWPRDRPAVDRLRRADPCLPPGLCLLSRPGHSRDERSRSHAGRAGRRDAQCPFGDRGAMRAGANLRLSRTAIAAALLAILFALFISIHPRGLSVYVLTIWANQGTLLALAAIAQFFVVLVRGIDLSVGPVVALTNVVASYVVSGSPLHVAAGVALALMVGVACGLANGAAVVVAGVPPIVATLALGSIYSGLALLLRPIPGGEISDGLSDALTYDVHGVPASLIIIALALILLTAPLRRTRFGMSLYAIGSSREAALMSGIRVRVVTLSAYGLGGLFAALAGLYVSMVTLTGDPNVGPPYTLNSIAAVVIGGVALSGGVGSPLGAALGAFILKTISGLMFFSGLPPLAQPFFEGAILAIAIALGAFGMLRVRSRLERFA